MIGVRFHNRWRGFQIRGVYLLFAFRMAHGSVLRFSRGKQLGITYPPIFSMGIHCCNEHTS
ncbi:hypothetical protein [Oculatella sp. FACHB-28]|uniref:hypothetical protein n=1 Tax=Oculatella sp. FACHB-28 TaxID=2692845 RepID=UPI0016878B3C|nr:hypothetical protein [Oculatella sp. FACHB-28]